jgi:hypothetical protein
MSQVGSSSTGSAAGAPIESPKILSASPVTSCCCTDDVLSEEAVKESAG